MNKTLLWKKGDTIIDCRTFKTRIVKKVIIHSSFSVIETMCNKKIIDEEIIFWDLIIPDLIFNQKEN